MPSCLLATLESATTLWRDLRDELQKAGSLLCGSFALKTRDLFSCPCAVSAYNQTSVDGGTLVKQQ